jgi:lysophospholipase L1-like esterase
VIRSAALMLITALLCLLVAECVLRQTDVLEFPPAVSKGHPTRGYTLRPGFSGETAYGVPVRINAFGFRSPEIAVPKPAALRRVVILGDSVTFAEGVAEEESFSRKLETALRRELACPLEIVNAGTMGYGTIEEADLFANEIQALEPDLLIVYQVENDNLSGTHAGGRIVTFVKDHLVYRSYLVGTSVLALRKALWLIQANAAGGDQAAFAQQQLTWQQRPGTAASLAALRQIAALARTQGTRVILASHPAGLRDLSLDAPRNQLLAELAAQEGMSFVDVGPALMAHRDRDLAVSARNLHPNAFAHGVIAEALQPALREALACTPRAGAD